MEEEVDEGGGDEADFSLSERRLDEVVEDGD